MIIFFVSLFISPYYDLRPRSSEKMDKGSLVAYILYIYALQQPLSGVSCTCSAAPCHGETKLAEKEKERVQSGCVLCTSERERGEALFFFCCQGVRENEGRASFFLRLLSDFLDFIGNMLPYCYGVSWILCDGIRGSVARCFV